MGNTHAVWEFVHLGLGGIFAQSEWLFWEALGLLVGLLGVLPLSVHTIPNQVTSALCFGPFMCGIALAIRLGVTLPHSVKRAKMLAVCAVGSFAVLDGLLQLVVYYNSGPLIAFFTTDPEATALAESIWWKVCGFNWLVAVFAMLCGVATGLGQQWLLGAVNFSFLFLLGLPATYYLAVVQGGGLGMVWLCVMVPYLGINLVLIGLFATTDWYKVQNKIRSKEAGLGRAVDDDEESQAAALEGEHMSLLGSAEGVIGYGAR